MKNPSGNKLEKLVFGMFDQMVEGADKYVTKQGSTWLIFTESKKWVIEFTKDKTLWFNYNIFQGELELIGKDCTEERDLIKNWFESRFLNKPKVEETLDNAANMIHNIEDTIQNGVKDTRHWTRNHLDSLEDTIENGVKETKENRLIRTISVISTIKNGVKHVEDGDWLDQDERIDDIINNGVKETKHRLVESWEQKEHLATTFEITESINDAIENGVKELQPLPARDGNRDWGLYYHRQEDRTKPHTEYVKEVIEDSYNHRGRVEGVIRNTDKDGI